MGIAGSWSSWKSSKGEVVFSYTMLTINADAHDLMKKFHKPADEKRMVVILPESGYSEWLETKVGGEGDFLVPYPAELLVAASAAMPSLL